MADLSRVKERDALKPKPKSKPYWYRLHKGCHLGYCPSAKGTVGSWIARAYNEDTARYREKALGQYVDKAGADRFAAAKKDAEAFAEVIAAGGQAVKKMETVADACREYAKDDPEAEKRFARYVYGDPIAKVKLAKLRRHHLTEWRERIATRPALVSRRKEGEAVFRDRAPATLNRDMVPLRAALNAVLAPGAPNTEAAWQEALKPIKGADRQRTLYLDKKQRLNLLGAVDAEIAPFVRALCLLPLRPGAMAALSSGDYDKRTNELTIGKDKDGKSRRIVLPLETAKLFAASAKTKLPAAPLFMRADGKRWNKDSWGDAIEAAVISAGLPAGATAYTLRHSVITDLVATLPLLAIAQISGTSVEMIERHYGHLNREAARDALAGLAL